MFASLRTFAVALLSTLALSSAWAATLQITFDEPATYTGKDGEEGAEPLLMGESFMMISSPSNITGKITAETAPFYFDEKGVLHSDKNDASVVTLSVLLKDGEQNTGSPKSVSTVMLKAGYPACLKTDNDLNVHEIYAGGLSTSPTTTAYYYLIIFDTRAFSTTDGALKATSTATTAAYRIAPLGGFSSPMYVNRSYSFSTLTLSDPIAAKPITSYDDGSTTYEGEELAAYLTPTIEKIIFSSENGETSLTLENAFLQDSAQNTGILYCLETKANLSDSDWVSVDNDNELRYTRLVSSEIRSIKLPINREEKQRFYRIRKLY